MVHPVLLSVLAHWISVIRSGRSPHVDRAAGRGKASRLGRLTASACFLALCAFGSQAAGSPRQGDAAHPAAAAKGACHRTGMPLPAEVRIGYLKLANAQLVAKGRGLHEQAMCVPIRWIGFETGGQVNAAIAAGEIDFGAMGGPPASVGVTRGLGYRGILLLNLLQGVEGLVVRPAIATPADLAGKRIATPFGSTSHYLLNVLLKQAGCRPTASAWST